MSGIIDSAEGPASPALMTKGFGTDDAEASELDNQYVKANRKGEITLTKLNSNNYQSWADDMEILLSAKRMWTLVVGTEKMPGLLRPRDRMEWLADDAQAKAWIYVNVEDRQHNHIERLATSHAMWEALKKVHGEVGQWRLNFLKIRFFKYKAGATESIDDVCSNLSRLQMTIRNIKSTEAPTDLDVALVLINSVHDEAYTLAKYHLEAMDNLTLDHARKRLKLVEQKIKDDISNDEMANKTGGPKGKDTRKCYHCKKRGHIKPKCYKWLATDGEKNSGNKKSDRSPGNARLARDEESDDSDTA